MNRNPRGIAHAAASRRAGASPAAGIFNRSNPGKELEAMKQSEITLQSLDIDCNLYFFGTDEEIEAAEKKEEARAAELEKIIFSDSFRALEYYTTYGSRIILHHSTRPGVDFQLSYIAADGVPTMHENYYTNDTRSKKELLKHYVDATIDEDITARLLTA